MIAGLGLALVSIKPNFAIPLALGMLARRDYRAVSVGVLVGGLGALIAAAVLVAGDGPLIPFAKGIAERYGSLALQPAIPPVLPTDGRIDATALVSRLAWATPGGLMKLLIFCGCLGVGLACVWRLRDTRHGEGADSLSGVLIVLSMLTCIYHQIYDAVVLTVPILAVASGSSGLWRSLSPRRRPALVLLLALPAANYLATTRAITLIGGPSVVWTFIASLNAAGLLVALLACGLLALRVRKAQASGHPR